MDNRCSNLLDLHRDGLDILALCSCRVSFAHSRGTPIGYIRNTRGRNWGHLGSVFQKERTELILGSDKLQEYIKSKRLLIHPFSENTFQGNVVDLRLGDEIARLRACPYVFDTHSQAALEEYYTRERQTSFAINPRECLLVCTREKVGLPDDLMGFVNLRSTYTRLGLFSPCGVVQAGFNGQLTIEIIGGSFPLKIQAGDRMFQMVFMMVSSNSKATYKGRYQNQTGVTLPILNSKVD